MVETSTSNEEDQKYNEEVNLLDGLYEFHPEFFAQLTPNELKVLKTYYLIGCEIPENVFEYRNDLIVHNPAIEDEAQAAFSALKRIAQI